MHAQAQKENIELHSEGLETTHSSLKCTAKNLEAITPRSISLHQEQTSHAPFMIISLKTPYSPP